MGPFQKVEVTYKWNVTKRKKHKVMMEAVMAIDFLKLITDIKAISHSLREIPLHKIKYNKAIIKFLFLFLYVYSKQIFLKIKGRINKERSHMAGSK